MSGLRSWFRLLMPPGWAVMSAVWVILTFEYLPVLFRQPLGPNPSRDMAILATVAGYAIFRVFSFHPICRPDYRRWLEATPWKFGKPLPMGPVHLAPQDVLVVAALTAYTLRHPYYHPGRVPLVFLAAYLFGVSVTFWPLGNRAYAYQMLFGLGLVVRYWANWGLALVIALWLYPAALVGLRKTLIQFPWELPSWMERAKFESINKLFELNNDAIRARVMGWPYDRLPPRPAPWKISHVDGILVSVLAGWWTWVIWALILEAGVRFREAFPMFIFPFVALLIVLFSRLILYCWSHRSPLSLWGRLLTLRWIIPGYDKVFVAPLCALAIPCLSIWILVRKLNVPPQYGITVGVTTFLLCVLNMGPTLTRWQLTGKHRVVPGYTKQGKFMPSLTKDFSDEVVEI